MTRVQISQRNLAPRGQFLRRAKLNLTPGVCWLLDPLTVALTLLLNPSLGAGGLTVASGRVPGGLLVGGFYAALAPLLVATSAWPRLSRLLLVDLDLDMFLW